MKLKAGEFKLKEGQYFRINAEDKKSSRESAFPNQLCASFPPRFLSVMAELSDRVQRPACRPLSSAPDQTPAGRRAALSERERVKARVTNTNALRGRGLGHLLKWTRKGRAQGPRESTGRSSRQLRPCPSPRCQAGMWSGATNSAHFSREAQNPDFYVKSLNF